MFLFYIHAIIIIFSSIEISLSGLIFLPLFLTSLFSGIEKEIGALQLEVREELLKIISI